jgi:hypothetical protein
MYQPAKSRYKPAHPLTVVADELPVAAGDRAEIMGGAAARWLRDAPFQQ